MHTKTLNRREFLKKVGMAGAVLAAMPAAKAVGMEGEHKFKWPSGEEHIEMMPSTPDLKWNKEDFYTQVEFMCQKAAELVTKTKGECIPIKSIIEVPRWMANDMKAAKDMNGYSTWEYLHTIWPNSLWATVYDGWPMTMTWSGKGYTFYIRA